MSCVFVQMGHFIGFEKGFTIYDSQFDRTWRVLTVPTAVAFLTPSEAVWL